ncbi:MAG TPA: hypothetical protein VND90_09060 [Terracidiphilus sp.]|nr:hypothetical protein [Terracidiphilus sp.]
MQRRFASLFFLSSLWVLSGLLANAQAFDLAGPKVDVHVKRGQVTLPIGQVPNLLPGDRLWIHPDLPKSQSEHFVLVIAFLRGTTNPPPPEWFTRVDAWSRKVREEGVFVTVPDEAEQALVFLAPATGGDFSTLRDTVRGRPGTFVRANQDLQAASLDRMRLDDYLNEIKTTSQTDPKALKERAEMAARSLGIKVNKECFQRPVEQQSSCLSQHTEGLVMDDANTQSRVSQLTSGSTVDLMNQIAYSSMGGAGAYSPYIGAILDTARILASLHIAHYQYIPALALPREDTLNLRLSVPPSFRNPKSVVVIALPPVGRAVMPPLHPVDPAATFCAQQPGLLLPAEGAPLALATQFAHDLTLQIPTGKGDINLPLKADAALGGLVLQRPVPMLPRSEVTAVVRGKWGFDDWEGPRYRLRFSQPDGWSVAPGDQSALVVGREDMLHIEGENTQCVDRVDGQTASGQVLPLTWKSTRPDLLQVSIPMQHAAPGSVKIRIHQFGLAKPDSIALMAYAEAASLDRLTLNAGELDAVLTGTRMDEVAKVSLDGIHWLPNGLSRVRDTDRLAMKGDSSTAGLEAGRHYVAHVELRDGRRLHVQVTVNPPRPQITLLSKGTQDVAEDAPSLVHLGSPDDLPIDRRLVFFLRSKTPISFPRTESVEVAAPDNSFHTTLTLADGSLMLEDAHTALGVVEPMARFGASAFGPVRIRAVSAQGVAGDWIPLGTLVRIPGFKELRCTRLLSRPCLLTGSNLFLAASFSSSPDFETSTDVPPDFTGTQLTVPHPADGILYLKLRDDPQTVQILSLPISLIAIHSPLAPPATIPSTTPTEEPGDTRAPQSSAGSGAHPPAASAAQPQAQGSGSNSPEAAPDASRPAASSAQSVAKSSAKPADSNATPPATTQPAPQP